MKNLLFLSLFFFVSCTPQKRLARLIKKNPNLVRIDTVTVRDTFNVITERTFRDSIFTIQQARHDTVIVKENNLTIRTIIKGDTVYSSGECDTIINTVVREVKVPYKTIVNEPKTNYSNYAIIILLVFLIIIIAYVGKKLIS